MGTNVGNLKINLSAIQQNWSLLVEKVGNEVEVAAVVKANAYGLGVKPVAKALYLKGCRTFFVANLNEAVELDDLFIVENFSGFTIIVLSGMGGINEFSEFKSRNLWPVLYSPRQIDAWHRAAAQHKCAAACVIKVDTGMSRLGLTESEFDDLMGQPHLLTRLNPKMLMSHLACADEHDHTLNALQMSRFNQMAKRFKSIVPGAALSLANSFGIFLASSYHQQVVRPGISLYGGNPDPARTNPMHQVVELSLPVLQIKKVKGPASVGYGATYTVDANDEKVIAIAAGGYADGIFRYLSNHVQGFIDGQAVPLVGRVSMDSVIFDVTAQAENWLAEPKSIELLGNHQTIEDLASSAQTISYEVLTQLGARYHREYSGLSVDGLGR